MHQRDRRTDTGRQQRPRLRIASRGNKLSIIYIYAGGYEAFSALYPFHRTQQVIYMPKVCCLIAVCLDKTNLKMCFSLLELALEVYVNALNMM